MNLKINLCDIQIGAEWRNVRAHSMKMLCVFVCCVSIRAHFSRFYLLLCVFLVAWIIFPVDRRMVRLNKTWISITLIQFAKSAFVCLYTSPHLGDVGRCCFSFTLGVSFLRFFAPNLDIYALHSTFCQAAKFHNYTHTKVSVGNIYFSISTVCCY